MAGGALGRNARSWAVVKAQPEHVIREVEVRQYSVGAEEKADN